jgi:hypothetical protein
VTKCSASSRARWTGCPAWTAEAIAREEKKKSSPTYQVIQDSGCCSWSLFQLRAVFVGLNRSVSLTGEICPSQNTTLKFLPCCGGCWSDHQQLDDCERANSRQPRCEYGVSPQTRGWAKAFHNSSGVAGGSRQTLVNSKPSAANHRAAGCRCSIVEVLRDAERPGPDTVSFPDGRRRKRH